MDRGDENITEKKNNNNIVYNDLFRFPARECLPRKKTGEKMSKQNQFFFLQMVPNKPFMIRAIRFDVL